jgi:hypothetical protein
VAFDSSWRPEGLQQARITATFDTDEPVVVMRWDSFAGPTFKPDATNERVTITIDNPPGASQAILTFWMLDARNNWWWAIDNVEVSGADITCPADMNADGGIDGADIETFFRLWEQGSVATDINADGGVDGGDVEAFFLIWEAGGC